jgi:hypothetical protein
MQGFIIGLACFQVGQITKANCKENQRRTREALTANLERLSMTGIPLTFTDRKNHCPRWKSTMMIRLSFFCCYCLKVPTNSLGDFVIASQE